MNFEFIKNLGGLNKAFDSCSNAEKLAKSMPDLSVVASRKSAEVIAKFVYLIAHNEIVEELTFADVLSDYAVKRYLGSRDVLDAFHFIRKSGNTAVHTLKQESPDSAIAVLEQLHYVVGEVARRMKLIRSYPRFDPNIAETSNVTFHDVKDIGKLSQEMYEDFIIAKNSATRFLDEFSELASPIHFIPGEVALNERIVFDHKPKYETTVAKIQEHFGFLALQAMRHLREEDPERDLSFEAEITLLGTDGYTASDLIGFMRALMYDLPSADGFTITSAYNGPSVAPWFNPEVKELFQNTVGKIGEKEDFEYSSFEFLYSHGGGICSKYENGEWIDLRSNYSKDIATKDYEKEWWSWSAIIDVEFDFDKYPQILDDLRNCVRRHIPPDQLVFCEQSWAEGEKRILVEDIQWNDKSLKKIQAFLDELNSVVEPIKHEFKAWPEGIWYQTTAPFAIASWDWTDEGFIVTGTEF